MAPILLYPRGSQANPIVCAKGGDKMAGRPIHRERVRQSKLLKGPRPGVSYTAEQNRARFNRTREKWMTRLEPRVCVWCKYAFLSRGGQNLCTNCHHAMNQAFDQSIYPGAHPKIDQKWRGWFRATNFDIPKTTLSPMIPLPDLDSPHIQSAIHAALIEMGRMMEETGRARLVRLPNLPPYPHLEFRGFKRGRPSRLNQIWGKENGI